jgi:hypothetical protein
MTNPSTKGPLARAIGALSPEALWQLQGELLEAGVPEHAPAARALDLYFELLTGYQAKATARQYDLLASFLDVGAVGGVALQQVMDAEDEGEMWRKLLASTVSESMMVAASRQYVKGADTDLAAMLDEFAWRARRLLWDVSTEMRPQMDPAKRRALVDAPLAAARDASTPPLARAVVLGRLLQGLLWVGLVTKEGE